MTRARLAALFGGAVLALFAIALIGPSDPPRRASAPRPSSVEPEAAPARPTAPIAATVTRRVEPHAPAAHATAPVHAVAARASAPSRTGGAGSGPVEPDEASPPQPAEEKAELAPPFQLETDLWSQEDPDPVDGPRREAHVKRFFEQSEGAPIQDIECRSTVCRVTVRASGLDAVMPAAADHGIAASIAGYQADSVVIHVPVESIDGLPGA